MFAKGAQIDTHSLVASALDMSDTVFNTGLLAQRTAPVFAWKGDYPGFLNSLVEVQNGAQLTSQTGGFVMLLGPRVVNNGSITTPGGQAILAAGAKVYLGTVSANAPGYYPEMRGILVEVDPYIGADGKAENVWENTNMVNHHGGVILVGDKLYGYSDKGGWTCQDFKTGEVKWAAKDLGKGAIHCADGMFYCLEEGSGTVALIEVSDKGWNEKSRFKLTPQTGQRSPKGKVWTHPVVSDGKLYLRDQELLFCFDVKAK